MSNFHFSRERISISCSKFRKKTNFFRDKMSMDRIFFAAFNVTRDLLKAQGSCPGSIVMYRVVACREIEDLG